MGRFAVSWSSGIRRSEERRQLGAFPQMTQTSSSALERHPWATGSEGSPAVTW